MHVSFILCPIPLLFLTSEGTGETRFLVEVEDGETESINADNGPNNGDVGSREDVDEDGRKAGQEALDGQPSQEVSKKSTEEKKGELKSDAAAIKNIGVDYGESPVREIPDLGDDFKS